MDRVTRNAPAVLLGTALAVSVALQLYLTRDMTFLQDTWAFLMNRRDFTPDALFTPHNEHIVAIPVAIEQLLVQVFGMSSATPEFVLLALSLAATAFLLFVYVRRRVGPWLALFAAVLLLFLGPAWEVLLWPFEISLVGSSFFGIAMLLALDRDDRRGDIAACAFLCLAFGFSTIGLSFAAAAAVNVFLKRRTRGLGRAYVAAIPIALYGLWYLGWGMDAQTHLSLRNVLASPRFVAESAAVAVSSVFGLWASPVGGLRVSGLAAAILVGLAVLLVYRQVKTPRFSPDFWQVAAAAGATWFLTAFNQVPGRDPTSSRYQYLGGILVLLLLANLLQGVRFGRRAIGALGALTAVAVVLNFAALKDGKDAFMHQSVLTRSNLAAIEIAQRTAAPGFSLTPEVAGTTTLVDVQVAKYLPAVRQHGSPAYTPSELAEAAGIGRRRADIVLSRALPLSTRTQRGVYDTSGGENCVESRGRSFSAGGDIRLSPGATRIEVAPGPGADVSLRRFATKGYPVALDRLPGDSVTVLRAPRDLAPQYPWHLWVESSRPVRICR